MATQSEVQQQAVDGIAAVEKCIIEQAGKQNIQGLRLEWNEDLDFGHMMDPVPVVVITADGRTVEEHFSIQEMSAFAAAPQADTNAKIEHIVQELAHSNASGRPPESRGV
jgi:hypothetical protein